MKKVFMLTAVVLVSLSGANAFAHHSYNYPSNLQRVEQRLETAQQRVQQRFDTVQQTLNTVNQRLDNVQQRIEIRQNRCYYSRYC